MERQNSQNFNFENNLQNNQELPKFVISVNNGIATMPISYANSILGSKENFYRMVSSQGWYLPHISSKAITIPYLMKVVEGTCFKVRVSEVRHFIVDRKKWKKLDLFLFLRDTHLSNVTTGWDLLHLPDRIFLLNILHTVDPNHEVFSGVSGSEKLVDIPVS